VVALFVPAVAIIALCYGGGFGTMPSFTADYFGTKFVGGIYGVILLAWGLAAIPSPLLIAYIRETTGTYAIAIYILAAVMLVSVALPFIMRPPRGQQTGSVDGAVAEPQT
jgi:OFA family oxalate/formate antiporter-like MFS transporter